MDVKEGIHRVQYSDRKLLMCFVVDQKRIREHLAEGVLALTTDLHFRESLDIESLHEPLYNKESLV